jgi:hypothetical protein
VNLDLLREDPPTACQNHFALSPRDVAKRGCRDKPFIFLLFCAALFLLRVGLCRFYRTLSLLEHCVLSSSSSTIGTDGNSTLECVESAVARSLTSHEKLNGQLSLELSSRLRIIAEKVHLWNDRHVKTDLLPILPILALSSTTSWMR